MSFLARRALPAIALLTLGGAAAQTPLKLEGAAASPTCADPVILMVWIEGLDRSKTKAYGEALRSTRIVPRHGGRYLAVGPPLQLVEGKWPANRAFVLEQYPCEQAFRQMWYSNEYQTRLRPLRASSGNYTVALFKTYKPPR